MCISHSKELAQDYASWFMNILHGALAVRKIRTPSNPSCRLCGAPREELGHFYLCPAIRFTFHYLDTLVAELWRDLGITSGWGPATDASGSQLQPCTVSDVPPN